MLTSEDRDLIANENSELNQFLDSLPLGVSAAPDKLISPELKGKLIKGAFAALKAFLSSLTGFTIPVQAEQSAGKMTP